MQKKFNKSSVKVSYFLALDGSVSVRSSIFYSQSVKNSYLILNENELKESELNYLNKNNHNTIFLHSLKVAPKGNGIKRNMYIVFFLIKSLIKIKISNYRNAIFYLPDKNKAKFIYKFFSFFFQIRVFTHSGINDFINPNFKNKKIKTLPTNKDGFLDFQTEFLKKHNNKINISIKSDALALFPKFILSDSITKDIIFESLEFLYKYRSQIFISFHPKISHLSNDILKIYSDLILMEDLDAFSINNNIPSIVWHGSVIDSFLDVGVPVSCYWHDYFNVSSSSGNRYKQISYTKIKDCYNHLTTNIV